MVAIDIALHLNANASLLEKVSENANLHHMVAEAKAKAKEEAKAKAKAKAKAEAKAKAKEEAEAKAKEEAEAEAKEEVKVD